MYIISASSNEKKKSSCYGSGVDVLVEMQVMTDLPAYYCILLQTIVSMFERMHVQVYIMFVVLKIALGENEMTTYAPWTYTNGKIFIVADKGVKRIVERDLQNYPNVTVRI